jgi:mercuric ion transport protein
MMNKFWGGILAVTAFVVCPCHLPLTLALLLGVLGGTGIGGFLAANKGLVYGVTAGYFVLALGAGLYLWNRKKRASTGPACPMPSAARTGDR